jgi:hypothetical protein
MIGRLSCAPKATTTTPRCIGSTAEDTAVAYLSQPPHEPGERYSYHR